MSTPSGQSSGVGRGRRVATVAVLGAVAAVLIGAFLVWLVFFSSAAPVAPTIDSAAAALQGSPTPRATSGADDVATPLSSAPDGPVALGSAATDGLWLVDTSVGDAAKGTNSYVGFRVAEVLQQIGQTEAIGRTPAVNGELQLAGAQLERASIVADLTQIASDQPRRDGPIQRALQTGDFPSATFVATGPVDLGSIPANGETIKVTVPGTLTVHGVAQDVDVEMQAQLVGDVVVVVGSLPVDFTSFGISMPRAPVVVSVEDAGDLEWQLFFRRQAS